MLDPTRLAEVIGTVNAKREHAANLGPMNAYKATLHLEAQTELLEAILLALVPAPEPAPALALVSEEPKPTRRRKAATTETEAAA